MNRIVDAFTTCKRNKTKAFIPYITAGDPTLEKTAEMLAYLATHGADIIEVGVPFSDPMADGPVIQNAMERAITGGTTLRKILEAVREFRTEYETPIILMGYYNPFYAYGLEEFSSDAHSAGVDGVLTVDLPPEEAGEFRNVLKKHGELSIFLLTPVSGKERIQAVKNVADGFVYFVSVTGVTGEREILPSEIREKMDEIRGEIHLPLVLGFGISKPETVRRFYSYADGFVAGSAVIKRWQYAGWEEHSPGFHGFFSSMVRACHGDDDWL
jgi:tryptophan synthase alpha chain